MEVLNTMIPFVIFCCSKIKMNLFHYISSPHLLSRAWDTHFRIVLIPTLGSSE
jgi:hypothetical protein